MNRFFAPLRFAQNDKGCILYASVVIMLTSSRTNANLKFKI